MDTDVGDDLALGWGRIDLRLLYTDGRVSLRWALRNFSWTSCPPGPPRIAHAARYRPRGVSPAPPPHRALGRRYRSHPLHPRRRRRRAARWEGPTRSTPITPTLLPSKARNGGRPALGGGLASRRSPTVPTALSTAWRCSRTALELRLTSSCLADAELRLAGADYPAFTALKAEYADVLGGAPPGVPPDREMELELETGDAPMPRSRHVKRLSDGELAELRAQARPVLYPMLGSTGAVSDARRRATRRLFHQARSGQQLSLAVGAGRGPVDNELSVVVRPVRIRVGRVARGR